MRMCTSGLREAWRLVWFMSSRANTSLHIAVCWSNSSAGSQVKLEFPVKKACASALHVVDKTTETDGQEIRHLLYTFLLFCVLLYFSEHWWDVWKTLFTFRSAGQFSALRTTIAQFSLELLGRLRPTQLLMTCWRKYATVTNRREEFQQTNSKKICQRNNPLLGTNDIARMLSGWFSLVTAMLVL